MILLDSRFCGYDLDKIGFPSVQTCMAVVAETQDWLVGWHAMSNSAMGISNDSKAFKGYIEKMGPQQIKNLYGVTHAGRHSLDLMKGEMRAIGVDIGFRGKVYCYQIPPQNGTHYIEFQRRGGRTKCEVKYADQANVSHDEEEIVPGKTRHKIIQGGSVKNLYTGDDTTSPVRTSVTFNAGTSLIADRDWSTVTVRPWTRN